MDQLRFWMALSGCSRRRLMRSRMVRAVIYDDLSFREAVARLQEDAEESVMTG